MRAACWLLSLCCVSAGAPPAVLALLDREVDLKGKTHKQFRHFRVEALKRTVFNIWQGDEHITWNGLLFPIRDQRIKEFYDQLPGPKNPKGVQAFLLQKFPPGSSVEELEVALLLQGFSSRRILTTRPNNTWNNRIDFSMEGTVVPSTLLTGSQRYACRLVVRQDDEGRLTELTVTQSGMVIAIPIMINK